MSKYEKGVRGERELVKLFLDKGFSVIRAAGSGIGTPSPDLLVFKRGIQYGFECKVWDADRLNFQKAKFNALKMWEENTGITTLIAWKIDRVGWRFIYLDELSDKRGGFSITREKALRINRTIGELIM